VPWRSAEALLRGVARFDLRPLARPRKGGGIWRRPPIPSGSRVIVYASGPRRVRGLVGEFTAGGVRIGSPGEIASFIPGDLRAILRGLAGYAEVMLLEVSNTCRYKRRIPLEEVRRRIPGWQPPPGYRPLKPGDGILGLVDPLRVEAGCGYSPSSASLPSGG
jgi:predicted transcriptional regulator